MPSLITSAAADRLVASCRDRAGERLRSVTYFTKDDFDQVYLREDLERGADLQSFIGVEWRESGIIEDAYHGTELGEHEFTIRAFENGYLLRVADDDRGIFITTDGLSMEGFSETAAVLDDLIADLPG